ncbi:PREDICTED: potassium channel subfamily K member 5-like [Galeopterus variegatus]|uniref:Potassium channel subfamily K member 5-like n=1 Tax=Galeopterus variegatus TaxID=482537 RepID=A0ABM0SFM7_GALVR|nr:PREDICTED: potassium channel subfamily K member 5-like [Galeopterus variegatus]
MIGLAASPGTQMAGRALGSHSQASSFMEDVGREIKVLGDSPDTRSFTVETELSELGLQLAQVVSDAAGQGVAITGNQTFNNWNWPNAMIFAATVITTIGYGNVAPKTPAGRLFCVFYGLSGVPLCLTWISALGKFFGGRAKRLGQFLTKRGVSLRKAQITCTAIFILWGVLVHLVIPPFVFMVTEEWNYIEGLYYSFITISTIGFGDFVAVSGQQTFAGAPGRRSVFWALRPPAGPGLSPQGNGLPALPTALAPLGVYSKNWVPSLEGVSQTLRSKGHVSRPPGEEARVGPPEADSPSSEVLVNQLDRISEEGEPWDAQDYHPLISQNASVAFVNKEAGFSDEETSKSSLEDNLVGEERPQEGADAEAPLSMGEFPSSDESTFTSTESELSVPYEQLMNEYSKANGPKGT